MTKDFDPTIKTAKPAEQVKYWQKRAQDLAHLDSPGSFASKGYPLRQAKAELKKAEKAEQDEKDKG